MAKINIDGKIHEADPSKNLLELCLSLGYDLPYFCWHPGLGSVGACRQCAVIKYKDENDTKGKLFMACMEPASDGTRISLEHPEARQFRKNTIEWLMMNHPHDCPVCDEGGECHLQDMTVMTGHDYRRYRFKKRTYYNQNLGPFINHEMNRCIQCYRCVRFYREYADGSDFNVYAAHDHLYFGRYEDGTLENEFSGNLVEVCPTGVFTDKTLKQHYTRKWDLTTAPSICTHCSVGCNTIAGERYGSLRRILSRYNSQVNGYFLCDRGRFGYEFVNQKNRIKTPMIKSKADQQLKAVKKEQLLNQFAEIYQSAGRLIGVGSDRASMESNFALQQLVGPENFYAGVSKKEFSLIKRVQKILSSGSIPTASLKEVENSDAVLVLGEDLTNTAPMLALAVRQAARREPQKKAAQLKIPDWQDAAVRELVQDQKGPVFIASSHPDKLDDIAEHSIRGENGDLARFGFALAGYLDQNAVDESMDNDQIQLVKSISEKLMAAENPLIISGTSSFEPALIEAAAAIGLAIKSQKPSVKLAYVVPQANSMGLSLLANQDLDDLIAESDQYSSLVLENDLVSHLSATKWSEFEKKNKQLIVLDSVMSKTVQKADLVISTGTFAESDGTFVNNEGRAQRFYQVYPAFGEIWESWRWLGYLRSAIDPDPPRLHDFQDYVDEMVRVYPQLEGMQDLAPPPGYRWVGQKIPRQPHRYSGRTAMQSHHQVHEPKPAEDPDSALTFTMEGYKGQPPSSVIPFFWSPGWNSVQSINKYQIEVGGPLHGGDPGFRLFSPIENGHFKVNEEIPAPFEPKKDQLKIQPLYHIFGSEPLSNQSPAVASLVPAPYIGLNSSDAKNFRLNNGQSIKLKLSHRLYQVEVKVMELPQGTVGWPMGIPGLPGIQDSNYVSKNNLEV
ncbi:MAG: NADH-quinone oxidoreductase subunit NuoG [Candidatus Cyclobacteriaceae bacterium M3_2C_046]